jgi:hypothetical protein
MQMRSYALFELNVLNEFKPEVWTVGQLYTPVIASCQDYSIGQIETDQSGDDLNSEGK